MFKDYITILVGTLQRIHRQYIRHKSALDDTLIGIENLNSGYLTHHILDPKILAKYLEAVEDDLEETVPEFELVFTSVYQYYGNSLISFTNTIGDLLLQLPILIKLKVQEPMSLFSIETAPVPLDAETYIGEKREYTQIILETELIALTENNYIPLTQAQISLCARLITLENRTAMMEKTIIPVLKDFKQQINNTNRLNRQYRMMTRAHDRYNRLFRQTHKTFQIHHLALLMVKDYITILVGMLQRIHRQYVRYESALDDTLIGIEHLNSGYLTHRILDPKTLAQYLEAVEDDLEETAPAFEPVFTNVYQYYGNSLISFTNIIDDLLLQLLILIKLKVQVPMSLFSIETAPVPLDAETYLGEKREYTQIIPETELIALTENNYIPLAQAQILLCAKIGYMYYCEYAHLLKKCTEHTCMSAIYYDQGSDVKVKQCKTIVTFDTISESNILDAGNLLILSNLQKPWTIACKDVSRVFEIEYSTYCILNRLELCEC